MYYMEAHGSVQAEETQFNYAYSLIRSKYPVDIKKGIFLLEKLCKDNSFQLKEVLYNLALGNVRLKENITALKYARSCLYLEPQNEKFQRLEKLIVGLLKVEGYSELLVAGGVLFIYVSIFLIGLFIYKKTH